MRATDDLESVTVRLDEVLAGLYASEINYSLTCFWDAGVEVKLGDALNGFTAEANVPNIAAAAAWLDEQARQQYPDSHYAQSHRLRFNLTRGTGYFRLGES